MPTLGGIFIFRGGIPRPAPLARTLIICLVANSQSGGAGDQLNMRKSKKEEVKAAVFNWKYRVDLRVLTFAQSKVSISCLHYFFRTPTLPNCFVKPTRKNFWYGDFPWFTRIIAHVVWWSHDMFLTLQQFSVDTRSSRSARSSIYNVETTNNQCSIIF